MISKLCQSAALDRFVTPWAAKIVEFLIAMVKTILAIEKMTSLRCMSQEAERRLSIPSLAQLRPMMAKIESIGWRAQRSIVLARLRAVRWCRGNAEMDRRQVRRGNAGASVKEASGKDVAT